MTRRALKTAEVTKVDQLCEVGRRSTNRRERERVSLLPAAGGDGTEDWWIAAITAANSASLSRGGHLGLFPRRTKAGSSNTAYPRSGPRRQFSGFSPRRFGVFHDTNTLEVP